MHDASGMIHPTAIIDRRANIAADTVIGPYSIVGPEVTIGPDCSIGAHVVIDIVGAAAAKINIDAAAIGARIVCLGRVGGTSATFDLDEFARKRLRMIGVTFRTRSLAERIEAVTRFRNELLPAIASGLVKPVIDRVFPLDAAGQAQDYMRGDMHFGKIVLALEAP